MMWHQVIYYRDNGWHPWGETTNSPEHAAEHARNAQDANPFSDVRTLTGANIEAISEAKIEAYGGRRD